MGGEWEDRPAGNRHWYVSDAGPILVPCGSTARAAGHRCGDRAVQASYGCLRDSRPDWAIGRVRQMMRFDVHFEGRVQGVGFRYTVCRVAKELNVTGFVQNLSDGRVRLVAEGGTPELERLISSVEATMAGYIRNVDRLTGKAQGEFEGFGIRY